jgi:flavin reductase
MQLRSKNAPDAMVPTDASMKNAFRDGMTRLGAAVNIVATDGVAGRAGFTASAVCSVTDSPPTLLVCLNRAASVYQAFRRNGVLCVNTLSRGHEHLSQLFGGKTPMAERFAAGSWHTLATGAPVFDGAVVAFDCRVMEIVESGTHDVMFCNVEEVELDTSRDGLVYFARRYHGLSVA